MNMLQKWTVWFLLAVLVSSMALTGCDQGSSTDTTPGTEVSGAPEANDLTAEDQAQLTVLLEQTVADRHQTSKTEDHFVAVDQQILALDRQGDQATAYLWVLYEEYHYLAGLLTLEEQVHTPAIAQVQLESQGWQVTEYWEPRSGSYLTDDIKEHFPQDLQAQAMDSRTYLESQEQRNFQKARAHYAIEAPAITGGEVIPTVSQEPDPRDAIFPAHWTDLERIAGPVIDQSFDISFFVFDFWESSSWDNHYVLFNYYPLQITESAEGSTVTTDMFLWYFCQEYSYEEGHLELFQERIEPLHLVIREKDGVFYDYSVWYPNVGKHQRQQVIELEFPEELHEAALDPEPYMEFMEKENRQRLWWYLGIPEGTVVDPDALPPLGFYYPFTQLLVSPEIIDQVTFDVDSDGKEEECMLAVAYEHGIYSFKLQVLEDGKVEYGDSFYDITYNQLAFQLSGDRLQVVTDLTKYQIQIENGHLTLVSQDAWHYCMCHLPVVSSD